MKKVFLLFGMLLCVLLVDAQNSGRGFAFQAVARNLDGTVMSSQNIELKFSLKAGAMAVSPTYVETHVATTDSFGVFAVTVGKGIMVAATVASYADINFAEAEYWIKVEVNESGTWTEIANQALLSVPYAEAAGNVSAVPTGTILPFGGDATQVPTGWFLCDGTELSRTVYANLYNVIGLNFGEGTGNATFNVPDMRGVFIRGVDNPTGTSAANKDPNASTRTPVNGGNAGNAVGSYQGDEYVSHNHTGTTTGSGNHTHTGGEHQHPYAWRDLGGQGYVTVYSSSHGDDGASGWTRAGYGGHTHTGGGHSHGISSQGGSETRSKNVYVNYIIKL